MSRRLKFRPFRVLRNIFFIVVPVIVIYLFLTSPLFEVKEITISGNKTIKQDEIYAAAAPFLGEFIWQVNDELIEEKLKQNILLKEVNVNKKLPSTLSVEVKERYPLAFVLDRELFLEVDNEGYVLNFYFKKDKDLPLIRGVTVKENISLGEKIEDTRLTVALEICQNLSPSLVKNISKIDVSSPNQIKIYTPEGIEIRLGKSEGIEERFALALELLPQIPKEKEIEYLDFSSRPTVKYKEN